MANEVATSPPVPHAPPLLRRLCGPDKFFARASDRNNCGARVGVTDTQLTGAVFGLALYYINFYGFTKFFPWFADARDGISIFTHIVQSALMAWIYKLMDRPRPSTTS